MKHKIYCPVYRQAGSQDCSNGGLTAKYDIAVVVYDAPYLYTEHNGKKYLDKPDEEKVMEYAKQKHLDLRKVLVLCDKFDFDNCTPYLKPLDEIWKTKNGEKRLGPMFGGNYVEVEYRDLIRVHDRYETEEEYANLSK